MQRPWLLLIALSIALSLAIPLIYGGQAGVIGLERLSGVGFLLLLAMVVGGWCFNGARVRLLARNLGAHLHFGQAVATVLSAEFAGLSTPAGAGEPAIYVFLLSRHGLRVGEVVALVAVDKFMDLVFFGTAIPIVLALYFHGGGISHPLRLGIVSTVLLVTGFGVLVLILRHYRKIVLLAGRGLRRIPRLRPTGFRFARWLVQFQRTVRLLLGMPRRRLVLLYLFCVGHWMLRYGVLPMLLWLLGESVPWAYLFAIQGVLLLAGQVTFLPGGGGGVEVGFGAFLSPYLDAATTATALLLWRFFTFYWYLIAGAPTFALMSGKGAWALLARRRGQESTGL